LNEHENCLNLFNSFWLKIYFGKKWDFVWEIFHMKATDMIPRIFLLLKVLMIFSPLAKYEGFSSEISLSSKSRPNEPF
jgi:hypothetical protein